MKKFIQSKLFLALREASQKGIEADTGVLEQDYDDFALLLFSECVAPSDRVACYNSLVYVHAELANLTGIAGKKCRVC
jgi:hypothetical protein